MTPLTRRDIEAILPHRAPFLLLDEVTELVPGLRAVGKLFVSEDAFWVPGHFPGNPVMPGVLIIEALAQCGAMAVLSLEEHKGKTAYFAALDTARFKRRVLPGDTLTLSVELERFRFGVGQGRAVAMVDNQTAASAALKFSLSEDS